MKNCDYVIQYALYNHIFYNMLCIIILSMYLCNFSIRLLHLHKVGLFRTVTPKNSLPTFHPSLLLRYSFFIRFIICYMLYLYVLYVLIIFLLIWFSILFLILFIICSNFPSSTLSNAAFRFVKNAKILPFFSFKSLFTTKFSAYVESIISLSILNPNCPCSFSYISFCNFSFKIFVLCTLYPLMSHHCNFLPRFSLLFHKFGLLFFQYPSLLPNSIYQPLKYIFYCFRHVSPCFIFYCIFPALFFPQFLHMLEKFFSRYLFYPFFFFVYFVPPVAVAGTNFARVPGER